LTLKGLRNMCVCVSLKTLGQPREVKKNGPIMLKFGTLVD